MGILPAIIATGRRRFSSLRIGFRGLGTVAIKKPPGFRIRRHSASVVFTSARYSKALEATIASKVLEANGNSRQSADRTNQSTGAPGLFSLARSIIFALMSHAETANPHALR